MIIMPMPMPSNNTPEPKKCPQCEKAEDIIKACKHCGYEYIVKDDLSWAILFLITIFFFIIIWAILTLFYWIWQESLHSAIYFERETLYEILCHQYESVVKPFTQLKIK